MSIDLNIGNYYWVDDPVESYLPAQLIEIVDQNINLEIYSSKKRITKQKSEIKFSVLPPISSLHSLSDDLVQSNDVIEPYILWTLKNRYFASKIYSSIGSIIIAINPYRNMPEMYSTKLMNAYMNENTIPKPPPHVWEIVRDAYFNLYNLGSRQALIISGESGAGKTETTKKCLQFLSTIASSSSTSSDKIGELAIEDKVINSNPLLESFGNAKTTRNNNSSRFGKWLEVSFVKSRENMILQGANITQYLLEKSRVVTQSKDERNYHIFYQLCASNYADVGNASNYTFLNQSECFEIPDVNDKSEFAETLKSFQSLSFPQSMQTTILNSLVAILKLGNINFIANSEGNAEIAKESKVFLEETASIFGLHPEAFADALCIRTHVINGAVNKIPLNQMFAKDLRNALAKEIYGRLFSYIIYLANLNLNSSDNSSNSKTFSIGLLDIFGFEILTVNSLEQLAINFCNEKLQNQFINYVVFKEQEIYLSEGIDFQHVTPKVNKDIISLIEGTPDGIFSILEDLVKLPKSTDANFLLKLEKTQPKSSPDSIFYKDVKMQKTQFMIRHFAGEVKYDCNGFFEKNKDKLYEHIEDLLLESTNENFRDIIYFSCTKKELENVNTGSGKKKPTLITLLGRFQNQLGQLMNVLDNSEPHFIKCIKPNTKKSPEAFESPIVLQQLRYSGLLDAIKVRKKGFPTRNSFADFKGKYWSVVNIKREDLKTYSDKELCQEIIQKLQRSSNLYENIRIGRSIVFYRPEILSLLEEKRNVSIMNLTKYIQSLYRMQKAIKSTKILSNARAKLRLSISRGSEKNRGNVEELDTLITETNNCEFNLNLGIIEIKQAKILTERLQEVFQCFKLLAETLNRASNNSAIDDICEEYKNAVSIDSTLYTLNVPHPRHSELKEILQTLKERAVFLESYRNAIDLRDHNLLKEMNSQYSNLKIKYGSFCSKEESISIELIELIKTELALFDNILSVYSSLSSENLSIGSVNDKETILSRYKAKFLPYTNDLEQRFLSSQAATIFIKSVSILMKLREEWIKSNWHNLSEQAFGLSNISKEIDELLSRIADTYKRKLQNLSEMILNDIEYVKNRIDEFVSLPSFQSTFDSLEILDLSVSNEELITKVQIIENGIKYIESISIYGQSIEFILNRLRFLNDLLVNILNNDFSKVISFTENSDDLNSRKKLRIESIEELDMLDINLSDDLHEELKMIRNSLQVVEVDGLNLVEVKQKIANEIDKRYLSIAFQVESYIELCRERAIAEYMALQCIEMCMYGMIKGSLGNIEYSTILIEPLGKLFDKFQSLGYDIPPIYTESFAIYEISKNIYSFRNLILSNSWESIYNLYVNKQYDFCSQFLNLIIGNSSFSQRCHAEIDLAFLEGRNNHAYYYSIEQLSTGKLLGVIGDIQTSNLNIIGLSSSVEMIKDCKVSYPENILVMLENLLQFTDHFVRARQAFYDNNLEMMMTSIEALERVECPEVALEEYSLMRDETNHLKIMYLLQSSLGSDYNIKYFETDDSIDNLSLNNPEYCNMHIEFLKTDKKEDSSIPGLVDLLIEAVEIKTKFEKQAERSEAHDYFDNLVRATDLIVGVRTSVRNCQWAEACNLYEKTPLISLGLAGSVISSEIQNCKNSVFDMMLIEELKLSIVSTVPTGSIGLIDFNYSAQLDKIDKALNKCQDHESQSNKVKYLFNLAVFIRNLRKCLKSGDWIGIQNNLSNADSSYYKLCSEELERVQHEVISVEVYRNLIDVILEGQVVGLPGEINCSGVIQLGNLIAELGEIPSEHLSQLTNELINLAPILCTVRKFTIEKFYSCDDFEIEMSNYKHAINHYTVLREKFFENQVQLGFECVQDNEASISFMQNLHTEFDLLHKNYLHHDLQISTLSALSWPFLTVEDIGKINKNNININDLSHVFEKKIYLDQEGVNVSNQLSSLSSAAKHLLDIRQAILVDDWDLVETMIRENLIFDSESILPPTYFKELELVALEIENRTVVIGVQRALDTGRLELTETDSVETILGFVQYDLLEHFTKIDKAKELKSNYAKELVDCIEVVYELRKMVMQIPKDWDKVLDKANRFLSLNVSNTSSNMVLKGSDLDTFKARSIVSPEIENFKFLAQDQLLYMNLLNILSQGNARGRPGSLDISEIDSKKIAAIFSKGNNFHAHLLVTKQHLEISQLIRYLRDSIKRAFDAEGRTASIDAWKSVKTTIDELIEIKKAIPNHSGFQYCQDEIYLIGKECHIHEVRSRMITSLNNIERIYARNQNNLRSNHSLRASILINSDDHLSINDLSSIIFYAEQPEFSSKVLNELADCCRAMRKIRNSVISKDWPSLNKYSIDEDILNDLSKLSEAQLELTLAKKEAHNSYLVENLETALKTINESDPNNFKLEDAINFAQIEAIGDLSVKKLVLSAEHILLLRRYLFAKDHANVDMVLRWFDTNGHTSPDYVKAEVKQSKMRHNNSMLIMNLIKALGTGKATGFVGSLNFRTIDITLLEKNINQAINLEDKSEELEKLIFTAQSVLNLRIAQKSGKIEHVVLALDQMKDLDILHPTIIEEVAAARAEIENFSVISILVKAIKSFNDTPNRIIFEAIYDIHEIFSNYEKFQDYMRSTEDVFNVEILEKSIVAVENYGIFSRDAKKLHKTVSIILSLRQAKASRNWAEVQNILNTIKELSLTPENRLDIGVDPELSLTVFQMEMRDAIKNIVVALQFGWASCSNGIVDQSTIDTKIISKYIDQLENCLIDIIGEGENLPTEAEMGGTSSTADVPSTPDSKVTPSKSSSGARTGRRQSINMSASSKQNLLKLIINASPSDESSKHEAVKKEVFKLLSSSKIILRVRSLIQYGDLETATLIAETSINQSTTHKLSLNELNLYAVEIGRALRTVKLSRDMRYAMRTGNIESLIESLVSAYKDQTTDLGLLRVAEKGLEKYTELSKKQLDLLKVRNNYDSNKIQILLDSYSSQKIPAPIIAFCKNRITRLSKLNMAIDDLQKSCNGFIYGDVFINFLLEVAKDLNLSDHPSIKRIQIINKMPETLKIVSTLIGATLNGASVVSASFTMHIREEYCERNIDYLLDIYDNWRPIEDYFLGNIIDRLKQKENMLQYSSSTIPTSLTNLPPQLAALSVWMFSHNVCAIERNISSHPEILLRDLIYLGMNCVCMRDEILAQHLKLIRKHPHKDQKIRLFKSLMACLYHFPPSEKFESYILGVMILESKSDNIEDFYPKLTIRLLHESAFKYGYSRKITSAVEIKLGDMRNWLHSDDFLQSKFFLKPSDVQSFSIDNAYIRGTRENWMKRFNGLSGNLTNITLENFTHKVFDSDWDKKDKEVFMLCIMGTWPTRRQALSREAYGDSFTFKYNDKNEEHESNMRRNILIKTLQPPIGNQSEDREVFCKSFWRSTIHEIEMRELKINHDLNGNNVKDKKAVDFAMTWDLYRDIILTGIQWLQTTGNDMITNGRHRLKSINQSS